LLAYVRQRQPETSLSCGRGKETDDPAHLRLWGPGEHRV